MSLEQSSQKKERPFIAPGWYKDLSNQDYHGSKGTSSTRLKMLIEKTPAHMDYKANHPIESTDNMNLGSAVHSLILEKDKFDQEFFVLPELNLQTAHGRAQKFSLIEKNPGKICLTQDLYNKALRMSENLGNYIADEPQLNIMFDDGISETSIYWWYKTLDLDDGTEYKELLKCRPDRLGGSHAVAFDIKSCADASYTGFRKAIERYYYHVSAAMYLDGVNQCKPLLQELGHFAYTHFILLCVENEPPYLPASYDLTRNYLDVGKAIYRRCMKKLHDSRQHEKPPGYPTEIRAMEPYATTNFWIV